MGFLMIAGRLLVALLRIGRPSDGDLTGEERAFCLLRDAVCRGRKQGMAATGPAQARRFL